MLKTCQIIALFLLVLIVSNTTKAFELQFPVSCQIMGDCWVTNLVDLRGNNNQNEDYMCGKKSTNNSNSTHISLRNPSQTSRNYAVIAAEDGIIKTARNVGGFCGYRIVIDHGNGWETSYCHLKPKTIIVNEGDAVKQGQIIGALGMSGQANWPHLSFAVIRNGMIFDPYSGRSNIEGCTTTNLSPLWKDNISPPYEPAHLTGIGFTIGYPTDPQIIHGMDPAAEISSKTTQIALWGMMMNILKGDDIHMQILNPYGEIYNETHIIAKANRDYYPIYYSVNRKNMLWDLGHYIGKITITRNVNGKKITAGKFTTVEIR